MQLMFVVISIEKELVYALLKNRLNMGREESSTST